MITEILPPRTASAFRAMAALRPDLPDAEAFARTVDEYLRPGGYRLLGAFSADRTDQADAVLGFRMSRNLAWGAFCYVDDLATAPGARGRGLARSLLTEVERLADEAGCAQIHLDSGVQAERQAAHGLYFSSRYRITSYHFAKPLPATG